MIARFMLSLLQFGCLFVPGLFSGAQAAVVFMPLEDRDLRFYQPDSGFPFETRIPFDFMPGEGSLSLAPGSSGLAFGFLASQGPVRVIITLSPPPNIGGSVRALDAGSIIGQSLDTPAAWNAGEPILGEGFHYLYDGTLVGGPVSEFFKLESYIGLEFEIDGQTHYGWLSVELELGDYELDDYPWWARPSGSRITGFAYETEARVPIIAGAIPEPGNPLLLAMGIGALCLRRRNLPNCCKVQSAAPTIQAEQGGGGNRLKPVPHL
jgi:hypothetical protein